MKAHGVHPDIWRRPVIQLRKHKAHPGHLSGGPLPALTTMQGRDISAGFSAES